MVRIARFNIEFNVSGNVEKALRRISDAAGKVGDRISRIAGPAFAALRNLAVGSFAAIGAAAATATAAIAALGLAVLRQLPKIDKLAKTARELGVEFGELQTIDIAGRLGGFDETRLRNAILRQQRFVGDAIREPAGTTARTIAEIGLEADDLVQQSAIERLNSLAVALRDIENPAIRASIAADIFGERVAAQIQEFIRSGNLQAAAEFLERIGGSITTEEAARVEELNDAWTRLQATLEVILQRLAVSFAPVLTRLAGVAEDFAARFSRAITTDRIENAIRVAIQGLNDIVNAFGFALSAADEFFAGIESGFDRVGRFAGGFASLFGFEDPREILNVLRQFDRVQSRLGGGRSQSALGRAGERLSELDFASEFLRAFDDSGDKLVGAAETFDLAADKIENSLPQALVRGTSAATGAINQALFGRQLIDEQKKGNEIARQIERNTSSDINLNVVAEVIA